MRIRILSQSDQSNLPHFRSWFNVDKETTVASLKFSLCASVPALRDAHVHVSDLVLLLDDFELLDNSTVHILRDGDLVCLRRRKHLPKRGVQMLDDGARRMPWPLHGVNGVAGGYAAIEGAGRNGHLNHAPRGLKRGRSTDSSSSSSGSSSDSSSDDTSSSSESSEDSDSDSTSSSSSEDPPPHPPHPPRPPPLSEPPKFSRPTSTPVPPGFGKPQTHTRNERRRKKRLAMPRPVSTPEPMMMSLKNKNKRRGFKNTAGVSSRITFQDNVADPSPPPRLIPPSERDQLPPRLFVTSVDVEADIWPRDSERVGNRKGKKARTDTDKYEEEQGDVPLDYGRALEEDRTAAGSVLDYVALEKAWADAPMLVNKTSLPIGCVVGWQELGINPTTLTPETMLFLARVVAGGENSAVVVRLRRPGLGIVSFSGGDMKAEEEEEEFLWDKIVEMEWRLVSN
ncbi:hypothetical protein BJV78DRAFT_1283123 [Lactifluus subvellereus]|nr:hypothetical protein BJV78DRAFT_1283123 [Lactifluus subvellereus]